MKAKPVKIVEGAGYVACDISEATHLTINMPGPTGKLTLPVITKGDRRGTPCWTWNGCVELPTLKPSIKTTGTDWVCHSWVDDGVAEFLSDSTHEHTGKKLPLLEADK